MTKANERPNPGRTIGILGGMGPRATADLYHHIINLTPARKDQDHIRVLIFSNPAIPDRTKAIVNGGESPVPILVESAMVLERGGAGIIAMPCNTAHHFLPEIKPQVTIPFLDMIEETCLKLQATLPRAKTVGLLASIGTVFSGVYARALSRAGIGVITPRDAEQRRIQSAIDQVKTGAHDRSTMEVFESAGARLVDAGAEAVILGCTEVPLAFNPENVSYLVLNSTQILAEAAVKWARQTKTP